MRILYLGSTQPTACATFYARALQKLGHEVFFLDPNFFKGSSPIGSFWIRLTKKPLAKQVVQMRSQLIEQCKEHRIELVLNLAENFISNETLKALKNLPSPPKLIYHSHDNNFSRGILKPGDFFESLSLYDCVFTTKSQNLQRYRMLGQPLSFFIPCAFEPSVHRPTSNSTSRFGNKKFAVSFVGTYDRSRDRFLNAIGWDQLYVWGDRWKKFDGFSTHKDRIHPQAVYLSDFADVMSNSQIALGLLREEVSDRHTQRTFEIPACGAFQIAPRNDEILSFFKEDEEIVCFDSLEELKDKVNFYLTHASTREKIARNGFQKVTQSGHTYEDRVKTMLDKLSLS